MIELPPAALELERRRNLSAKESTSQNVWDRGVVAGFADTSACAFLVAVAD